MTQRNPSLWKVSWLLYYSVNCTLLMTSLVHDCDRRRDPSLRQNIIYFKLFFFVLTLDQETRVLSVWTVEVTADGV